MSEDMRVLLRNSSVAAAVAAGLIVLLVGGPWRQPRAGRVNLGGVLGVGLGIALGIIVLGAIPRWPPREDQDRLLAILLPAAVLVEATAVALGRATRVLRLLVAGAAARVLLHGSVYLSGAAGSDSLEWSTQDQWLILGGLAASLIAEWALLDRLAQRGAHRAVVLSLALATGATGVTMMLSGYASGGQLGFPLAAALAGAALASLCFRQTVDLRGAIGVGLVGLFALIVIGRFFGDLTTTNAALLFVAPLLAWLPELLPALRSRPWLSGAIRPVLVAVPVLVALTFAFQKFTADSKAKSPAPGSNEPSAEDYLNFGK